MNTYRMYDFMHYPNIAFKLSMIQPFNWSGSLKKQHQGSELKIFITKVWFIFGAANLIYQNFGMLIYLLVPKTSYIYTAEPDDEIPLIGQVSETGAILGLTIVGVCKMVVIFGHSKRISNLLEELQELFPSKHEQIDPNSQYRVHHFAKTSGNLMNYTTIFSYFALLYYNSLPILETIYAYITTNNQIIFHYQANTWYPWQTRYNKKSWLNFVASYLCQFQSSLTGLGFIMAGDFMLCFFITQMEMHFDYLANSLRTLNAASANANERLKFLIAYHIKLLRFSKEINTIFNISFLINFITSSIAICLMGFSMVMITFSHTLKYSVGLVFFLVFTFFICYNGDRFTTASDELMPSAFYNNWYEGDIYYRRMIKVFMLRSLESNVLRAYKFTTVSMPTFMAILELSYKLFTFVRAMD